MRCWVQPREDLNLQSLRVSRLLGWTRDDPFRFAHDRKGGALWEALRAREGEAPPETMAALRGWLGMAAFTPPFRFLDALLSGPLDGRRQLNPRLGREAPDPDDAPPGRAYVGRGQCREGE